MNSPPAEVLQTILWPGAAAVFPVMGLICLFGRKWLFAISLLVAGALLGGSWQYNRTHEEVSTLQLALAGQKLVKPNAEKPEESVYEVVLSGMELGIWK